MTDHFCRLKDLNEKAPEELKAYCECMDYYRCTQYLDMLCYLLAWMANMNDTGLHAAVTTS